MSLSDIRIYLDYEEDHEWNDPKLTKCPLKVYLYGKTRDKEDVYYEVMVTKVINNDLSNGTITEYIKIHLRQLENEEKLSLEYNTPYSEWDIFDFGFDKLMDMFFGDIIELSGHIDRNNISYSEFARRVIEEDTNNYGIDNQEPRLWKRLAVALKMGYILGDEIGKHEHHTLDTKNKTMRRYEAAFSTCIQRMKGKQ